jgi:hypothetical protein
MSLVTDNYSGRSQLVRRAGIVRAKCADGLTNRWLACLLALACASSGGGSSPSASPASPAADDPRQLTTVSVARSALGDTIPAPRQLAWTALPAAYMAVGLSVQIIDSSSQSVASALMRIHRVLKNRPLSRYLECGRTAAGETADIYEITMRVRSTVEAIDNESSILRTLVTAVATPQGSSGDTFRCGSTRTLESRIAALVTEQSRSK